MNVVPIRDTQTLSSSLAGISVVPLPRPSPPSRANAHALPSLRGPSVSNQDLGLVDGPAVPELNRWTRHGLVRSRSQAPSHPC